MSASADAFNSEPAVLIVERSSPGAPVFDYMNVDPLIEQNADLAA